MSMRLARFRLHGLVAVPLCALAAFAPIAGAQQKFFPTDDDLRIMLRYLVEDGETPGIVLGVLEPDGSKRILSYGTAGKDKRPLGPKSIFELGSITKAFTGILLADMVDAGEVSLNDPVARYLPPDVKVPSRNGREITLLDLATHRSSLTRMPTNLREVRGNPYPPYAIQDMYAFLSGHELRRDIGAEYEYSNIGAALLGHALTRRAGMSYEELVRKRILDPLGMRMTSTVVQGDMVEWNTQGHAERSGPPAPYRGFVDLPAMGALRSNAEDMLKFVEANVGSGDSRVARSLRKARDPQAVVAPTTDIGLHWRIAKVGDRRIVMHGGNTAGYSADIAFDPDKRVGFVMLTNVASFGDDVGLDFIRRGAPLALREVEVPRTTLARYVGMYQASPTSRMAIRLEEEGWLTVQAPNNVRFRLYAESDTSFFTKRAPWRFAFKRDASGAATELTVDIEGNVRQMQKVDAPLPPPRVMAGNAFLDLPVAGEEMQRYVGTYAFQRGTQVLDLRIFVENNQLMAQIMGVSSPSRILSQGNHEFRVAADPDYRIVFAVQNERAERLTLYTGDTPYPATRKP